MHRLLNLICGLALSLFAAPIAAFAALVRAVLPVTGTADHLHLMPGTPRSILETRRLGLA